MADLNTFKKVTIWTAGYDLKTARKCTSSEINKMSIVGTMVIIPPMVGIFSYTYGASFYTQSIMYALVVGILFSTVVLFLDRGIVGYTRSNKSIGMLGRVLFAILLGIILAEPLVIKAFESSIQERLAEKIHAKKQEAAISFDRNIATLEGAIDQSQNRLYDLQQAYTVEMDGTGGSGIRTKGPIYQQKLQDYQNYKVVHGAKVDSLQNEIVTIEDKKEDRLEKVEAQQGRGLVAYGRALHALAADEPFVWWGMWAGRLFFMFIEIVPIMIKISPTGDRGLYYEIVSMQDDDEFEIMQMLSKTRQKVAKERKATIYLEEYLKLSHDKIEIVSNEKSKAAKLKLAQLLKMAKERNSFKKKIADIVDENELLEKLHNPIDDIFDDFIKTLNDLDVDASGFSFDNLQT